MFEFKITSRSSSSRARTGEFRTPHGTLQTPALATVATDGIIRGMPRETMHALPLPYAIVNTFHILTKGILESIESFDSRDSGSGIPLESGNRSGMTNNTVHRYGNFPGVVASDSGGFQVFSLGFGKTHGVGKTVSKSPSLQRRGYQAGEVNNSFDYSNPLIITEEGVTFEWNPASYLNPPELHEANQAITLTPERSMEIQHQIGADMIFAFDECTSPFNSKEYVAASVEKTHRWLKRCVARHNELSVIASGGDSIMRPEAIPGLLRPVESVLAMTNIPNVARPPMAEERTDGYTHCNFVSDGYKKPQALFAIIQGGQWEDLRIKSAQLCASVDVPGFGIGGSFGSSFGDSKKNMHQILEWIMPHLPDEKPRHLLGIGQVDDLFECIERGVDLFDCVIPTREARHKVFYTKKGKVELKRIKTSNDPIALDCNCIACSQKITGVQIYELFLQKDPRAFIFATAHNVQFFADLMEEIRYSIQKNSLPDLKRTYLSFYR